MEKHVFLTFSMLGKASLANTVLVGQAAVKCTGAFIEQNVGNALRETRVNQKSVYTLWHG